jgi:hypothetical protein
MKRIRYRWVCFTFSTSFGSEEDIMLSLESIQSVGILLPAVVLTILITKMHDSLPLQLFSRLTLATIVERGLGTEIVIAPWCLLRAALTLPDISTSTRVDLLKIGFWFLFIYFRLGKQCGFPANAPVKISRDHLSRLSTDRQLYHALNTFIAQITIIHTFEGTLPLNRLGSNPLEHAFRSAGVRCHDVNTMKITDAFTSIELPTTAHSTISLFSGPRGR